MPRRQNSDGQNGLLIETQPRCSSRLVRLPGAHALPGGQVENQSQKQCVYVAYELSARKRPDITKKERRAAREGSPDRVFPLAHVAAVAQQHSKGGQLLV